MTVEKAAAQLTVDFRGGRALKEEAEKEQQLEDEEDDGSDLGTMRLGIARQDP